MKRFIRRLIPTQILRIYHYVLARLAAVLYRHPSASLIVIGVTGTNGKSTTVNMLGRMLDHMGYRVGWTTTANFKIAEREWVNDKKMTMLGRFQTQKMLRLMVEEGCTHAIVETSSQGVAQYRHIGINYDIAVFTNLSPEHIEAHGGFEPYKQAKKRFFQHVANAPKKPLAGGGPEKTAVVNIDDTYAPEFLSFDFAKKIGYGMHAKDARPEETVAARVLREPFHPIIAKDVETNIDGATFRIDGVTFDSPILGRFNVYNTLAAIGAVRALGASWTEVRDAVAHLTPVPGRLERIEEGQPFTVLVDYAYEPAAVRALYDTLTVFSYDRLIHVLGSAGGGRDVARRSALGALAANTADVVIVTTEDPYDEDPQNIIDEVADAAVENGKKENETLFRILDRQEAINQAVAMAKQDDLVLITGKGNEPVMAVAGGKTVPWDDRQAARNALHTYEH